MTGAGKEPKRETHFVEVNENFRAYSLFTHRHTPEVTEHLGLAERRFDFHDALAARGARNSFDALRLAGRAASGEEVEALYRQFYAGSRWCGSAGGALPELQHVAHTNFCDIGFALDPPGERLVVV